VSCEYHKQLVECNCISIDPKIIHIIGNSIEKIDLSGNECFKTKNKFLYISKYETDIMPLLKHFNDLRKKIPDAELHIYAENVTGQQDSNHIFFKTNKDTLLDDIKTSDYWYYPTNKYDVNYEYALTLLSHQSICLGNKMVAKLGNVIENNNYLSKIEPYYPNYFDSILQQVISFTEYEKTLIRRKNILWLSQRTHEYSVLEWLCLFGINYETSLDFKNNFNTKVLYNDQNIKENSKKQEMIRVKMLCNWTSNNELINIWKKMCNNGYRWNNIEITDSNDADYFCIANFPKNNDYYVPERTIVIPMEEMSHRGWFAREWIKPKNYKFMYYQDERNNIEWHLGKSYNELMTEEIIKTKVLSSVTSSEYVFAGHIKRIEFLKYIDDKIKYDLYGRSNKFNLRNYIGELEYHNKNEGILPYKYTIACENESVDGYFTEKIVDAILGECVCFYWGCPNIGKYIDETAFIRIDLDNHYEAYKTIIKSIKDDEWSKRIDVIRREKRKILNELQIMPTIEKIILESKEDVNYNDNKLNNFYEYREKHLPFHCDEYLMEIIDNLIKKTNAKHFIETGSYRGASIRHIAENHNINVYSCDINSINYKKSLENTKEFPHVKITLENSKDMLVRMAKEFDSKVDDPIVFWLDAHTCHESSLIDELKIIMQEYNNYYIFMDDFKNPYNSVFKHNRINFEYNLETIIKNGINPENIYFPNYNTRTSIHHPLIGWALFTKNKLNYTDDKFIKHNGFYDNHLIKVINLERRKDRMNKFNENHKFLSYERFDAVDGKKLVMNADIEKMFRIGEIQCGKRFNINHGFNRGEIGCALSHIRLWQELLENEKYDNYIIIEDDAEVNSNFNALFNKISNKMKNNYDLLFLGFHDDNERIIKLYGDEYVDYDLGILKFSKSKRYNGGGTHGYCITKKGASKLLKIIEEKGVQQAIDHFLIDQFACGEEPLLDSYKIFPHIVVAQMYGIGTVDTDIQNSKETLLS